ncbi:hypothetical protein BC829DRAFT_421852 [Chytridium lagenaria]|nr:hypothetical protein BC829DRAFT_421852 [Chytridium lagenaria]
MDAGADLSYHESGEGETIASDRGAFGSEAAVSDLMTEATEDMEGELQEKRPEWTSKRQKASEKAAAVDQLRNVYKTTAYMMETRDEESRLVQPSGCSQRGDSRIEMPGNQRWCRSDGIPIIGFRKMGRGAEALRRCKIAERKSGLQTEKSGGGNGEW